jgi:hypothetical protein
MRSRFCLARWGVGLISGLAIGLVFMLPAAAPGATGGGISGSVADQTGAVVQGAAVSVVSSGQHAAYRTVSDGRGFYAFPDLPVGSYELTVSAAGFATQRRVNLRVDTASALVVDVVLSPGGAEATVTVTADDAAQVDTVSTQLGEVVSGAEMRSLPLNGRSYTDLLALQPGVAPLSTLLPSSIVMAGVTGSLDPSGDLNPGNLSINGQRESSNGFLVDGIDVQEHMNGGTSVIPNLDSIDQFRVLTNNFDPEYGNYNGGMITVVTRAGTNGLHGGVFEFLRNTALDARGYFDPERPAFRQNQFGGTVGGPVRRDKVFFFVDYQGTRTTEGISTGNISVPSLAERGGTFGDLTGSVSGSYLASLLSAKLGYAVGAGEAYRSVFPGGVIPERAWSAPGMNLLQYIPKPNTGANQFSTSAYAQTVRDDKGSVRVDGNTRWGQVSGYYFVDEYGLDNPYPGSVAGASVPGFDGLFLGRAQVFALGATNVIGQPKGGLGVSLAAQGFVTGEGTPGIVVQAPQFEGVQNIDFPGFTMGVPITNETQVNNTVYVSDGYTRVLGTHTLKFGGQMHDDEVNEHPNGIFNGTFNIDGTETGDAYADFLIGVPSSFQQSSGGPFYLRTRYVGVYGQDSWRVRAGVTVNAGLRWDVVMPFWEKYNQIGTYVAGEQSVEYPGALAGVVVAGDPGVPRTIAPTSYRNFAPRIGVAWAPHFEGGVGRVLFGESGKSSVRASYGLFYTEFPGVLAGIMYAVPPFGFTYISPGPPLLATPFITAATGVDNGQRFPFALPGHNVSRANPDGSIDWANFLPFESDPFFNGKNRAPYLNSYMVSWQRQVTGRALLTVSYVGNQGHRIPAVVPVNAGDPGLCLSLAGCGPFGEDNNYTNAAGQTVRGTRVGQNGRAALGAGENFGENTSDSTIANSNYNALETTLRYERGGSQFLLSYAYAKSIDEGSNIGEQMNPFDGRASRTISAWDERHSFVASYTVALPVGRANGATEGWSVSGASRFATGFPVTLSDNSDRSLLGTLGNGVNNYLLDTPRFLGGALGLNRDGRSGRAAFNTGVFPEEVLGALGNAKRRMFYGPGIDNYDVTLQKSVALGEGRALDLRVEGFNVFNHAQFYGPAAVDGEVEDANYGRIVSAQAPRLMQVVGKFRF